MVKKVKILKTPAGSWILEESKIRLLLTTESLKDTNPGRLNMVTGAFSYTGKYITKHLLSQRKRVRTLTGHPERESPFDGSVEAFPYNFDSPQALTESLQGVEILYNTYWIRFPYGKMTFDKTVANTKILLESAQKAGVRKIVHISIMHADERSSIPYFRGKGIVERFIKASDLSYAILRPALIFGKEDILINNIAWHLRKFPIFGLFRDGSYRVQPIYVEDLAKLSIYVAHREENTIIDVAGPETFTYDELIHLIKDKVQSNAKILHLPPWLPFIFSRMVGKFVNDVVITKDEVDGLMGNCLCSPQPLRGKTRLSSWLDENKEFIGGKYASELKRHYFGERFSLKKNRHVMRGVINQCLSVFPKIFPLPLLFF